MRLLIYSLVVSLSLSVAAETTPSPARQQNTWQKGEQSSQNQANQLMHMAKDEDDASMKYMMMMMAMQQQAQAAAYKKSEKSSQPDKKKETDDKAQSQLAQPSAMPSPPAVAANPEESLVFQDNIKAINEKIIANSKKEVTSSYPIPVVTPLAVDMNLSKDVASIPEEVPAAPIVAKRVLSEIPESARMGQSTTTVLASVSLPMDPLARGPNGAVVDARGANATSVSELGKLSNAIEQTVNPSPARKAKSTYEDSEPVAEGKPEKSGGSSFNSMMEAIMGQLNPEEAGTYDDSMGVEFGEFKTGQRKVPNIFQVAQFLYQVSADEARLRKPASKK